MTKDRDAWRVATLHQFELRYQAMRLEYEAGTEKRAQAAHEALQLDALNAYELSLPVPARHKDALDYACVAVECPVCRARKRSTCLWSAPRSVVSPHAHRSRRVLATPEDVERWARIHGIPGPP